MEQNIQGKRKKPKLRKELTLFQLVIIGVVGAMGNGALFGTVGMVNLNAGEIFSCFGVY